MIRTSDEWEGDEWTYNLGPPEKREACVVTVSAWRRTTTRRRGKPGCPLIISFITFFGSTLFVKKKLNRIE